MADELLRPTITANVDLSVRPWRLMSQAYVAFFGGVIAVTVIAFLNARRLGVDAARQWQILAVGVVALVVSAAVVVFLTDDDASSGLRIATRVVAVVCCLVQLRIQRPMDRAFQLRGTDYKSLWVPGIAAVIGLGLLELALLAVLAVTL
jgi:phosphoglycerol transferase MdoB-like AlkP superfamily enzyme